MSDPVIQTAQNSATKKIVIAIDAMGGDYGVESTIPGAGLVADLMADDAADVHFLIFGDRPQIEKAMADLPVLRKTSDIRHCDKIIENDDKPSAALRSSKGTSMRMAIEAVQAGEAQAVVSSGNTGALMALSKMVLKTVPGIHRPAIASVFPTMKTETIMLDLGANVLVDAENLVQFAVLGSAFARAYKNIQAPSIGLLNVGSEDTKGPEHVRSAAKILSHVELNGRYYGFVEGDDITKGTVDVIVSDGYAGNIALKACEGVGKLTGHYFKEALTSDPLAIIGGFFAYFALKRLKQKVDPRAYNGGVFLGLNGLCVKSHGGSDAYAFSSALKLACALAKHGYIDAVSHDINALMSQELFLSLGAFSS